jgi:ComEC/Rec2-related protein
MLGEHTEVSQSPVPWLFLRCSLLFVAVILCLLTIRSWNMAKSLGRWSGSILSLGIVMISSLYGYVVGTSQATRVDGWLGQPVIIEATVVSISKKRGHSVWLEITSLQPATIMTGSRVTSLHQESGLDAPRHRVPCHVEALWWSPKMVGEAKRLQPGSKYRMRGVFIHLTSQSPQHRFSQSTDRAYGFRGAIISEMTSIDKWQSARDWIHHTAEGFAPNHTSEVNLLLSMVFGGGAADSAVKNAFLSAGLLHVLVASGANVLLLEVTLERGLYPIWRVLRLPRGMWSLGLCAAIWGFAGLSGFDASVVRAAWMANYRIVGQVLGRKPSMDGGMAYAALLMALTDPGQLLSLSACMSFLATLAIRQATSLQSMSRRQGLGRHIHPLIRASVHHAITGLKVSVWIEATLLPVTLYAFGQMTPLSVLSNVLVEPLLFLLLPSAAVWITLVIAHAALSVLSPLCVILQGICFTGIDVLLRVVHWIASFPFALITLPKPPLVLIGCYYLLLYGVPTVLRHRTYVSGQPGWSVRSRIARDDVL